MKNFEELYEIAAERKGGSDALEKLLTQPKTVNTLRKISDDRWLAGMTKCIFQAGFNWKVVEAMWPGFEAAFDGFDIGRCAMMNEDDFDRLVSDTRIVRYGAKIRSVQENAFLIGQLASESGSAGKVFAEWPSSDFVNLLTMLKNRGSRLGGTTSQYFLRSMGKDSFILSRDVTARLIAEGVIDKPATSKKALDQTQSAFNTWMEHSGKSLTEISRVLAMSV